VTIWKALEANFNPTVTGLALRLSFHDAATWNPFQPVKGGCAHGGLTLYPEKSPCLIETRSLPSARSSVPDCGRHACRANGSIRYEFDWPSNAGLQRFMWPMIWVGGPCAAACARLLHSCPACCSSLHVLHPSSRVT
jgi:hypothetical protein